MSYNPVRGAVVVGLAMLAPTAAAWGQEGCLAQLETVQGTLRAPQGTGTGATPDLSHLVEAAQRYAAQGQEEECLRVVEQMREYVQRAASVPEVAEGGETVRPEMSSPATEDDGGVGDGDGGRRVGEAQSPVAPPASGGGAGSGPPEASLAGGGASNALRASEIVGKPLVDNAGRPLGEIVDLAAAKGDPQQIFAVVKPDGDTDAGDAMVVVALDRLRVTGPQAVQLAVEQDTPTLENMPAYDPNQLQPVAGD